MGHFILKKSYLKNEGTKNKKYYTIQANIYRFTIIVYPFILFNQNTTNYIIKLLLSNIAQPNNVVFTKTTIKKF